jgi:hypothetical protein
MAYGHKTQIPTHKGKNGDHVVGGAVGAAAGGVLGAGIAGAAQGAAAGATVGPVGIVAGTAIGAAAGALLGKGIAEEVNPTTEDTYWRDSYLTRPYVDKNADYSVYRPAYRHGVDAYTRFNGRSFEEIESDLGKEWTAKGEVLPWHKAQPAARDAYERLYSQRNK